MYRDHHDHSEDYEAELNKSGSGGFGCGGWGCAGGTNKGGDMTNTGEPQKAADQGDAGLAQRCQGLHRLAFV